MKKLKVNVLSIAALAIGVLTMSFKMVEKITQDEEMVWRYTPSTAAGHNNPANYVPPNGSENCPNESDVRCTLEAPDNGSGQPDLSQATKITFKARYLALEKRNLVFRFFITTNADSAQCRTFELQQMVLGIRIGYLRW